MHLRPLPLFLLTLPALAQTPGQIGLRLTNADITRRSAYFVSQDASGVTSLQEVNPPARLVPELNLVLPAGEGAVCVDLLSTRKTDTLRATTTNPSGAVTDNRLTRRSSDLQAQLAWAQPLVHLGKADFTMTFGLRYERGTFEDRYEGFDAGGASLGGSRGSSQIRRWGPTTGLQIHLNLGERTSLRSNLTVALMHGSWSNDASQALDPSGTATTTQAPDQLRSAGTTFNGDLALGVKLAPRLEASFGYEHRDLNGTVFSGPFVGVNYRF